MEMEIGNGNIKKAGLLAALIDLRVVAGLLFVCIRSSPSLQFRRGKLNSQFIVTARIDLSIISNFKVSSYCPCIRGRSPGAVRP